jgi:hypothetical protein
MDVLCLVFTSLLSVIFCTSLAIFGFPLNLTDISFFVLRYSLRALHRCDRFEKYTDISWASPPMGVGKGRLGTLSVLVGCF